jgi:hypothetical protein
MITMEFEEMKKIWDTQNNEPLYVINEKALHNRILFKQKRAGHVANFTERLLIFTNVGVGLFVLGVSLSKQSNNVFMYLTTAWMFITTLYVLVSRIRRMKGEHRFDRSMLGDLNHALSNATYQVRLSLIMRWNIIPVGVLLVLGFWENAKSILAVVVLLVFFVLAYYSAGWEHNIYKARKRELDMLLKKLQDEEVSGDHIS